MTKEEILEEFDLKVAQCHPFTVTGRYKDGDFEYLKKWLSEKLDQYAKAHTELIIPPEKPMSVFSFCLAGEELERYMRYKGWNECRGEIRDRNNASV